MADGHTHLAPTPTTTEVNPYVVAKAKRASERAAMADLSRRSGEALKATRGDKLAALKLMLGVA
jgi:hypothetical protein